MQNGLVNENENISTNLPSKEEIVDGKGMELYLLYVAIKDICAIMKMCVNSYVKVS